MAVITSKVIATGFPAVGIEQTYRNNRNDFITFMLCDWDLNHGIVIRKIFESNFKKANRDLDNTLRHAEVFNRLQVSTFETGMHFNY